MIDKNNVKDFFDRLAPSWDEDMIKDDAIIKTILDNAGVMRGKRVLDVACGTGVMIPYYLERDVDAVTGVDISRKMIEIAASKYRPGMPGSQKVSFMCMDAEVQIPDGSFDAIVIYNAFPHFPNPAQLLSNLEQVLASDGMITVAHGMSREAIDSHHSGSARQVSNGLPEADVLAELFGQYFDVTTVLSTDRMYQVCGRKRQ